MSPPPDVTRVLIADDQALVRAGFHMILDAQEDIQVVAEACDGEEAVAAWRRFFPDVILMDIRMPKLDGLEATRRIMEGGEGTCRIVMLTTFDLDEYVYAALRAGASGFLLKDVSPEQLIAAVRQVAVGDALLAPSITRRLIERFAKPAVTPSVSDQALSSLTPRELEVWKLMARGLSNAEIATTLFLSEATVKTHVAHILPKLGVRDRVQAVVLAYESGIVRAGDLPPSTGSPGLG
jgi:DNA-binding NarL/FixJ family response regulator